MKLKVAAAILFCAAFGCAAAIPAFMMHVAAVEMHISSYALWQTSLRRVCERDPAYPGCSKLGWGGISEWEKFIDGRFGDRLFMKFSDA